MNNTWHNSPGSPGNSSQESMDFGGPLAVKAVRAVFNSRESKGCQNTSSNSNTGSDTRKVFSDIKK